MDFLDTLTLDAPRRTNDGYLAASVRVARTGIQEYSGREVDPKNEHGLRDKAVVRVYRPAKEVFDANSLASLAHKPVTVNHPPVAVTADNWRDYSVGIVGDKIEKDGDFVRVPLALMDGEAIRQVAAGKNQLSCGYSCTLAFDAGTLDNGEQYDAIQSDIRFNHLSVVDLARGGDKLKIGDGTKMKTIMVDGHSVEVSDAAEIAIAGLNSKLADANSKVAALTTQTTTDATNIAKLTTDLATSTAKITTLEQQVKDASITPEKLRAAGKSYADAVATAKAMVPTITIGDSMDETAIKRAVVDAKLGAAAKDWTAEQVAISFDTLKANMGDALADALKATPGETVINATDTTALLADAAKARAGRFAHFENAHLGQNEKAN